MTITDNSKEPLLPEEVYTMQRVHVPLNIRDIFKDAAEVRRITLSHEGCSAAEPYNYDSHLLTDVRGVDAIDYRMECYIEESVYNEWKTEILNRTTGPKPEDSIS